MNPPLTRRAWLSRALLSLTAAGVLAASEPPAPLAEVIDAALVRSAEQYRWLLDHGLASRDRMPRTFEHGKLAKVLDRDWTVGFFPGSLWYLHEMTGDASWRTEAEHFTGLLEKERHNRRTHDVGFIVYCSFGNGLRLTGNPAYKAVVLDAAAALATRFNPQVGAIKSWDRDPKVFVYPVIIDNMMNLELLLAAAGMGGDPAWRAMAVSHADATAREHYRPDGSCFHVVDFDPATGKPSRKVTHQGYSDASSWSRGQAWGLYGYTLMARFTREPRFLAKAEAVAAYLMRHPGMPEDLVPPWDFDAPATPEPPRDSSAAAIMCSALFELASLTPDRAAAIRYRTFAARQLRSLCSDAYLARPGENGGFLLKHATGNHPKASEVDTPLVYGDYYFLEALLRARR